MVKFSINRKLLHMRSLRMKRLGVVVVALSLSLYADAMFSVCNIEPAEGCHCWDSDQPQVICQELRLDTIPELHPNMSGIHTLRLTSICFTGIPNRQFSNLNRLRRLLLDHNCINGDLNSLAFYGLNASLRFLDLSYNSINDISGSILPLKALQTLHLNHNNISYILHTNIAHLPDLKHVYLDNNPIIALSSRAFEQCPQLISLSLSTSEYLHLMNYSAVNLPYIENLVVINSSIGNSDLGSGFLYNLPALKHLEILDSGLSTKTNLNQLKYLRPGLLQSLEYISLANNKIMLNTLERKALIGLKNLKTLDLSGNRIKVIGYQSPFFYFTMGSRLEKLYLQNNRLTQFDLDAIQKSRNMTILDLSNNKLQSIKTKWKNLHSMHPRLMLRLAGNPWRCNCRLHGLYNLIQSHLTKGGVHFDNLELYHSLTCKNPKSLRGMLLKDVPISHFNSCKTVTDSSSNT